MSDPLDRWCPTCGARPGAMCITSAGNLKPLPHRPRLEPHKDRRARRNPANAIPRAVRIAVLRRSGGWCEVCPLMDPSAPMHAGEECHHVKRRGQGGKHVSDNLLWTCRRGHRLVHDHPKAARTAGVLV